MSHSPLLHSLQQIFHSLWFLFVLLLSHHPVLSSHFLTHTQQQTASWLASQWNYRLYEIRGMVVSSLAAKANDVLLFSELESPASTHQLTEAWPHIKRGANTSKTRGCAGLWSWRSPSPDPITRGHASLCTLLQSYLLQTPWRGLLTRRVKEMTSKSPSTPSYNIPNKVNSYFFFFKRPSLQVDSLPSEGFPSGSNGNKNERNSGSLPGLGIPWRRKWQPTPVFLPGESHGQRSLVGYSPQGCKSQTWLSN